MSSRPSCMNAALATEPATSPIIFKSDDGWVLDFVNSVEDQHPCFRLKDRAPPFFTRKPYFQVRSDADQGASKKRKWPHGSEVASEGRAIEKSTIEDHGFPELLDLRFRRLVSKSKQYFAHQVLTLDNDHDVGKREGEPGTGVDFLPWLEIAESMAKSGGDGQADDLGWFNCLHRFNSDETSTISPFGSDVLIPPKCAFYCSDIKHLHNLTKVENMPSEGSYSHIVLDPPWNNKSVRRSQKYTTINRKVLSRMPVKTLLGEGGHVLVWVTNNPKFHEFILNELFPKWGVEYHTTWYWVKSTVEGEPVIPLNSTHRKPYEPIIIGRRAASSSTATALPKDKVIVSIPGPHSRKPILPVILGDIMLGDKSCNVVGLELFARSLSKGWVSWGNEVLRFQSKVLYVPQSRGPAGDEDLMAQGSVTEQTD